MMTEPTVYKYALNVKMSSVDKPTTLNELFPSVEDLVVSSKKFDSFEVAINSVNGLVSGITRSLNAAVHHEKYKLISEINPRISGTPAISSDWAHHEVAKLWIVDEEKTKLSKGQIRAVGLAQLLEVPGDPTLLS